MIGRDPELADFHGQLDAVEASGGGAVVVLEGDAGIGKTTLVTAFAAVARARGFRRLQCAGRQGGATAGFAGLHELLPPVPAWGEALPPRQRAALLVALGVEDGPAPDRLLVGLAVLGLLEEVASAAPVLVVVEDVQWLDASSAEVLGFVARRLRSARVLLLVTARSGPTGTWLPEHGAEVLDSAATTRLRLGPLSPQHSEELLRSLDDPAPGRRSALGEVARRRVLQEAGGNPLALRELTRGLRARGPRAQVPVGRPLPTTRRLESAFLAEVADLPAPSRDLLLLIATGAGTPAPQVLAAGRELGLTPQDLIPLERADLVTAVRGRLETRHPLLRSAVYGAASATERVRTHRALAATVGDAARAVWHRAAAAPEQDEPVAAELEAAARRSAQRGARAEAAAALHRAAELSPRVEDRGRRLVHAAELARQAGDLEQAEHVLAEAATLELSPRHRSEWARARDLVSTQRGGGYDSTEDQLAHARALGGVSGAERPQERAGVLVAAAFHVLNRVDGQSPGAAAARRAVHDALAAVDLGRWDAVQQVGLAVLDPAAHAAAARPALPELLAGAPADDPSFLLALAQAAEVLQDLATARRSRSAAVETLHRLNAPSDAVQALSGLALLEVVAGDLPAALAHAEEAQRTALDLGLPLVAAFAGAGAAHVHLWTGRAAQARAVLDLSHRWVGTARPAGPPAGLAWATGLLALQEERHRDALASLALTSRQPVVEQWAVADLVEAAVGCGERATAQLTLDRVEAAAEVLGSAHLRALVRRGHALLADGPAAAEHYEASLALGVGAGAPLEQARTHLLYGEWLRRSRRVLEAREHLTTASGAFERAGAGAGALAVRAGAELRATGAATASRPVRSAPAQLTSQELQVARMAAAGLTNKEIADRIYVSPRTVSSHLYRVFPKLGVANRHQLRDALQRNGSG